MARRWTFLLLTGTSVCGGLILAVMAGLDDAPQSPLIWLQYPLLAFLAWGAFTTPVEGQGRAGFVRFLVLSWILGMLVELTLTVDGSGIGGVHPDTVASFVLAQGDYIPLAAALWAFHRWMRCQMREIAWIVAGMALTEGLVFTGSVTSAIASGSVVGAVIVTCYLIAIYMVYLLLPFRLCGVGLGAGKMARSIPLLVVAGFGVAFGVRVFWGLVYSPIVAWVFGLPDG